MAFIPRYTSREKLTTDSGSGFMQPQKFGIQQDPAQAAQMSGGADLQKIGQSIAVVAEKIRVVDKANSDFEASIVAGEDFATYEDKFNKTDIKTSMNTVDSDIAATREKISKLYDDPISRAEGIRAYDLEALKFKHKLGVKKASRIVDLGRANTLKNLDSESSKYVKALTTEEMITSELNMEGIMDTSVKAGLFSEEQGIDELKRTINSAKAARKDVQKMEKKRDAEIKKEIEKSQAATQEEITQMIVNLGTPTQTMPVEEIIKKIRKDVNRDTDSPSRIKASFAQSSIKSLTNPKDADPTSLESSIKFNELVERGSEIARREDTWRKWDDIPWEEVTQYRADVFEANGKTLITQNQLTSLLKDSSKAFLKDPVFQDALQQLAAQSSAYSSTSEQSKVKAEMYGSLMAKVIEGIKPRDAVNEVVKEKLGEDIGKVMVAEREFPSEANIEFTMKKRKLSREEVLRRMGFE